MPGVVDEAAAEAWCTGAAAANTLLGLLGLLRSCATARSLSTGALICSRTNDEWSRQRTGSWCGCPREPHPALGVSARMRTQRNRYAFSPDHCVKGKSQKGGFRA